MIENAALALALANEAGALDRLDDTAAQAALEAAVLPGRAEVLREAPLVIADGAHTRASIESLVEVLDTRITAGTTGLVAVVSATRGKDAARVLSPLLRRADTVIATAAEASRSLPAADLAHTLEALRPRAAITCADAPDEAMRTGDRRRRSRRRGLRDRLDVHGRGRAPRAPGRATGWSWPSGLKVSP